MKDFKKESVEFSRPIRESAAVTFDSAEGRQIQYDVFLSHSLKDATLIKQIKQRLERDHNISVYIDWDEDKGTSRSQVAEKVKAAMEISTSLLVVKTDNLSSSSWSAWETGYFDRKSSERIGVLLIEDEDENFTHKTFYHQEYLKDYELLGESDIVPFVQNGIPGVHEYRASVADAAFRANNMGLAATGALEIHNSGSNDATKFFGSGEHS
jgi:hypothetical protein